VDGKIQPHKAYGGVTLKIGPHHRRVTSFVKALEFEAPAEELPADEFCAAEWKSCQT
jgi:hypothetical protein